MDELKKLSKSEFDLLLGKSQHDRVLKMAQQAITLHAKKLSDKKLTSISVVDGGINLETKELYFNIQGKWGSQGGLNYTVRFPLKVGSMKMKFLGDVGNVPN